LAKTASSKEQALQKLPYKPRSLPSALYAHVGAFRELLFYKNVDSNFLLNEKRKSRN
jgi:hypothetical protein